MIEDSSKGYTGILFKSNIKLEPDGIACERFLLNSADYFLKKVR